MGSILTSITHASAHGGGSVSFAVGSNKSGALKVKSCVWTPRMGGSFLPKLNLGGSWPANTDPRELVIDVEGMIVGSSDSGYWTARAALMDSIVPPATRTRTIRHHGTLTIVTPVGTISALVNLVDHEIPLQSDSPRSSPYRISWTAPAGYWTGDNL